MHQKIRSSEDTFIGAGSDWEGEVLKKQIPVPSLIRARRKEDLG